MRRKNTGFLYNPWCKTKICVKINLIKFLIHFSFQNEILQRKGNCTRERKQLREQTLLDKFLFDEVMEDSENVKVILDIILGQDTELKVIMITPFDLFEYARRARRLCE